MTKRSLRGGALSRIGALGFSVAVSSSTNVAFFFARGILLARIVGPADFGVAVIILAVASAIDVLSDLGWDKFLIRSQDGEHPRDKAQAVVHLLRFLLGITMSAVIVLLALPLATILSAPHAALAIAALAVPVMARALSHIDYKHRQREFQFGGEALVETIRSAVDFAAAVAAALLLHSYWAMTIGITMGALASCAVSHIIARERFHLRWDPVLGRDILRFGSPLVVNNAIVYVAGQGDRLLVGVSQGVHALASYATVLTLVAGPQAVLSRGLMMVAMPVLARVRDEAAEFRQSFTLIGAAASAMTLAASAPILLFGPEIVHLVFGPAFHPSATLCGLLAVAQSMNILRSWAISGLVAHAHTRFVPMANGVRLFGFLAAILVASNHGTVELLAGCLALGELLGFGAALLWHARLVQPVPRDLFILLTILALSTLAAAAVEQLSDSVPVRLLMLLLVIVTNWGASAAIGWRGRSQLVTWAQGAGAKPISTDLGMDQ